MRRAIRSLLRRLAGTRRLQGRGRAHRGRIDPSEPDSGDRPARRSVSTARTLQLDRRVERPVSERVDRAEKFRPRSASVLLELHRLAQIIPALRAQTPGLLKVALGSFRM